jgi:D-glycero-alpha-D-manno-heptose-7-phosphate kinase
VKLEFAYLPAVRIQNLLKFKSFFRSRASNTSLTLLEGQIMIISRTPYRISLFGGGTDFPAWYHRHGGSVIAGTIDKYCYLTCRYLPPFFEHKYRIVWSKIENCSTISEISHPAVKAVINHLQIDRGLEIHHVGDLPARSGMGSSSAFTVGLLNALYAITGRMITKHDLAMESIHLEQEVLKETVGSQDQVSAAYGGLNRIDFMPNGEIAVMPITISRERVRELSSHLMLFFTGIVRTSSDVQSKFVQAMDEKKRQLRIMKDLVEESISLLNSNASITDVGELLHEAWDAKRGFANNITNSDVDDIHARAMEAGAIGGKLTGAGGGGFLLLFVPPEKQKDVKASLNKFLHVPFNFDFTGSQIIFADHDADYTAEEIARVFQPIHEFRELTQRAR